MKTRTNRHPAGIALVNMLMTIVLLSVAGLLFSQIFIVTFSLVKESRLAEEGQARWDRALQQMRQDMWRSKSVAAIDPLMIEIELSDGHFVRWMRRIDETVPGSDSTLIRSMIVEGATLENLDIVEFHDIGWYGTFEVHGDNLVLHSSPVGFRPEMEMTLVSQMSLADVTSTGDVEGGSP